MFAALTGITPVLVSETSSADHRGGFLGYVFIANCSRPRKPFFLSVLLTSSLQISVSQSHIGYRSVSRSSITDTRTCDGGSYLPSSVSQL